MEKGAGLPRSKARQRKISPGFLLKAPLGLFFLNFPVDLSRLRTAKKPVWESRFAGRLNRDNFALGGWGGSQAAFPRNLVAKHHQIPASVVRPASPPRLHRISAVSNNQPGDENHQDRHPWSSLVGRGSSKSAKASTFFFHFSSARTIPDGLFLFGPD